MTNEAWTGASVPAPAVQGWLAELRVGLLAGRGPGAGALEVLQHTRARGQVGGEPVTRLREQVAFQAASARRDVDGLALQVAEDRARLIHTVLAGSRPARSEPSGRAGALAAVLIGVLLRMIGRRRRRG